MGLLATNIFLGFGLLCFTLIGHTEAKCHVSIKGLDMTIGNDHFSASFSKGIGHSLTVGGGKNIAKKFYIDYTLNKIRTFTPEKLTVVSQSDSLVHVFYSNHATNGLVTFEEHFIVTSDVSGLYQYVVIKNTYGKTINEAEIRMDWRMNPSILNKVDNGLVQVTPPSESTIEKHSKKVWDATYQLSDGTYFSKYDFARYVRETNYYGVLGNGYGAWYVLPDHEFFSGGAQKQDLLAHQYGLLLMYMTGKHFGTPELNLNANFEKLYGPWLVYFTKGSDADMVKNVKVQVQKEKAKWPYSFIKDARYPLANGRGAVTGKVKGKKAQVVLQPPNEVCEMQVQGYAYSTSTVNQQWAIKNIRPGNYKICVYPLEGAAVGTQLEKKLTVTAGKTTDAGTLEIKEPSNIIWQLGQANHRSSEFKFSNEKRNWGWHLKVPKDLTFVVGKSHEANDWYYAQTQQGTWKIQFTDKKDNKNRELWVGLAAASYTPQTKVIINNHNLGSLGSFPNDGATYRCATQGGVYQYKKFTIPAADVVSGTNTLAFELDSGLLMYDAIVYIRG